MFKKFTPEDWQVSNQTVNTNAEHQRDLSNEVRQRSYSLRNQTSNKTNWEQYNTENALKSRMKVVINCKDHVNLKLEHTENEIKALVSVTEKVENAFEEKNYPLELVLKCLDMREERTSIDLVHDRVNVELLKEIEIIEALKAKLYEKSSLSYGKLVVLQECRNQLELDLIDKCQAIQVDQNTVDLKDDTKHLTLKDHYSLHREGVTIDSWEAFSSYNIIRADEEIKNSSTLIDSIEQTIQQSTNDLQAQIRLTNYSFRKRIHEIQQAINDLDWQKEKTEQEIQDIIKEINNLKVSTSDKNVPLIIVQSRLDNRRQRPNVELCKDVGQHQLTKEGKDIVHTIQALNNKLSIAENTMSQLNRSLERIIENLSVKNNSLQIEKQCMQIRTNREYLKTPNDINSNMINNNIPFTNEDPNVDNIVIRNGYIN